MTRARWDLAVLALLCLLLLVVEPRAEVERYAAFERLHHWNFFVLAPVWNARSGAVPGVDFLAQYGVGIPALYSWLVRLGCDGSLESLLPIVGFALVAYYFVFWRLLCALLPGEKALCLAGILAIVGLEVFGMSEGSVLRTPSSTALRRPLDMLLVWTFSRVADAGSRRAAWVHVGLAALAGGLATFWETDTGVAACVAWVLGLVFGATSLRPERPKTASMVAGFVAGSVAAFFACAFVAFGGRALAPEFVAGLLVPIRLYSSGFMGLRLFWSVDALVPNFLRNVATPAAYACAIALAVGRPRRERSARDAVSIQLAVYGLILYQVFLNRSAPANWYRACGPVIVLALFPARASLEVLRRTASPVRLRRAALACLAGIAACTLVLASDGSVREGALDYPSLLRLAVRGPARPTTDSLARERAVAAAMKERTSPGEPFLCLGMNGTQVLQLASRPNAGPSLDPLGTVMRYDQLAPALAAIERARPRYVVFDRMSPESSPTLVRDVSRPLLESLVRRGLYALDVRMGDYTIYRRAD